MATKSKLKKDQGKKESFSKPSVKDLDDNIHIVFSFRHLCKNQGAKIDEWAKEEKLLGMMNRIAEYSNKKVNETDGKTYVIYGDFPPKEKTDYECPPYVPEDANWARIHVNGKQVIVGHIVKNIFYVVFLDSAHTFWKSELKRT